MRKKNKVSTDDEKKEAYNQYFTQSDEFGPQGSNKKTTRGEIVRVDMELAKKYPSDLTKNKKEYEKSGISKTYGVSTNEGKRGAYNQYVTEDVRLAKKYPSDLTKNKKEYEKSGISKTYGVSTNEGKRGAYNQYVTEDVRLTKKYPSDLTKNKKEYEKSGISKTYGISTNEGKGLAYNQYVTENIKYPLQRSDWKIILYLVLIGIGFLFLAVYVLSSLLLLYPIVMFYIFHKTNIWQTKKRAKMGTITIAIVSLISIAFYPISLNKIGFIFLYSSIVNEIFFIVIIYGADIIRRTN